MSWPDTNHQNGCWQSHPDGETCTAVCVVFSKTTVVDNIIPAEGHCCCRALSIPPQTLHLNQSCRFHLKKDRKQICAGSRPTDSLPLFLCTHTLAVTLTSSLPLYSSAQLWRRSVLSSFMRCHAISIFLSGHCAQSCNFLGRKRKASIRRWRRRRKSHIWLHPRHLIFDQADCDQASNESQLFGDGINEANNTLVLFNHAWNKTSSVIIK